jgi:hypothetical protein
MTTSSRLADLGIERSEGPLPAQPPPLNLSLDFFFDPSGTVAAFKVFVLGFLQIQPHF